MRTKIKNKRKPKYRHVPIKIIVGTSIMVQHDPKLDVEIPHQVVKKMFNGEDKELTLNRVDFVEFFKSEDHKNMEEALKDYKKAIDNQVKNWEADGFKVYTLEKVIKTSKLVKLY